MPTYGSCKLRGIAFEVMPFLVLLDETCSLLRIWYDFDLNLKLQVWMIFSMRQLTQLLFGFFLLLVFGVSVTFTYYNSTPVTIILGSRQLQAQPVSAWIIGAFVSGGLLGLLFGLRMFRSLKSRAKIRRLTKALTEAEEEISNFRSLSLNDTKK